MFAGATCPCRALLGEETVPLFGPPICFNPSALVSFCVPFFTLRSEGLFDCKAGGRKRRHFRPTRPSSSRFTLYKM
eukprot:1196131-Prorocentrum_minimum.AAC.12